MNVMPFLENVTRGRSVPRAAPRAAARYAQFGGKSPINDQNRALIAALVDRIAGAGIALPIYCGGGARPEGHARPRDAARRVPGRALRAGTLRESPHPLRSDQGIGQ